MTSTTTDNITASETTFIVTLKPLASTVPAVIRLRQALKILLRAFNLRAIDVREVTDDADRDNSSEVINKSELHGNTCALIDPLNPAMTRAPDRTRRQVQGDAKREAISAGMTLESSEANKRVWRKPARLETASATTTADSTKGNRYANLS